MVYPFLLFPARSHGKVIYPSPLVQNAFSLEVKRTLTTLMCPWATIMFNAQRRLRTHIGERPGFKIWKCCNSRLQWCFKMPFYGIMFKSNVFHFASLARNNQCLRQLYTSTKNLLLASAIPSSSATTQNCVPPVGLQPGHGALGCHERILKNHRTAHWQNFQDIQRVVYRNTFNGSKLDHSIH